jgi:hypothetical protein
MSIRLMNIYPRQESTCDVDSGNLSTYIYCEWGPYSGGYICDDQICTITNFTSINWTQTSNTTISANVEGIYNFTSTSCNGVSPYTNVGCNIKVYLNNNYIQNPQNVNIKIHDTISFTMSATNTANYVGSFKIMRSC